MLWARANGPPPSAAWDTLVETGPTRPHRKSPMVLCLGLFWPGAALQGPTVPTCMHQRPHGDGVLGSNSTPGTAMCFPLSEPESWLVDLRSATQLFADMFIPREMIQVASVAIDADVSVEVQESGAPIQVASEILRLCRRHLGRDLTRLRREWEKARPFRVCEIRAVFGCGTSVLEHSPLPLTLFGKGTL